MDTLPVFKQILVDKGMLEEDKRSPAQKEKDAKKKVTPRAPGTGDCRSPVKV